MLKGKIRQVAANGDANLGDAHRDNPRVNVGGNVDSADDETFATGAQSRGLISRE